MTLRDVAVVTGVGLLFCFRRAGIRAIVRFYRRLGPPS
ncbi:MAG: hypothetical protein QOJ39_5 [Candidatus Eremiobacteraeota bacterium]|jgi:hypothetical protein|nr:hypothetical protein [Candidatus Eremiobacteraeota bacterium]MEA2718141.1 hypothetical protein [Candidatus Eremiobacteraeota bacterium]